MSLPNFATLIFHLYLVAVPAVLLILFIGREVQYLGDGGTLLLLAVHCAFMLKYGAVSFLYDFVQSQMRKYSANLAAKIHELSDDFDPNPHVAKIPFRTKTSSNEFEQNSWKESSSYEEGIKETIRKSIPQQPKPIGRSFSVNEEVMKKSVPAQAASRSDLESAFANREREEIERLINLVESNRRKLPFVMEEPDSKLKYGIQNDFRARELAFNKTLSAISISQQRYRHLSQCTKALLIADFQCLTKEHSQNLYQIDQWLQNKFARRLYEFLNELDPENQPNGPKVVALQELLAQSKAASASTVIAWQQVAMRCRAPADAQHGYVRRAFLELKPILERRERIDRCLLLKSQAGFLMTRTQAINRLRGVVKNLKNEYSYENRIDRYGEQGPSESEVVYHAFAALMNLSLEAEGLPPLKPVRAFAQVKDSEKSDVVFFFQETTRGVEYNVASGKILYKCEAGQNNYISAITLAIYLLCQKKSKAEERSLTLRRLTRFQK